MSLLQSVIVKVFVLIDGILEIFVIAPTLTDTGNYYNCTGATVTANGLTTCGVSLITQLGSLIVSGIGVLNGLIAAVGATVPTALGTQTAQFQ